MKQSLTIICLTLATLLWPARLLAQEPYAVLSDNNTVLTFYYDGQKEARGGMDIGPFGVWRDSGYNDYPVWHNQGNDITTVVFDPSFADCATITSTAFWFYDLSNLTSIYGISNLKTDNVTDMGSMFYHCYKLTSLDLSGFKTDNVTDMSGMFSLCSGLTKLDLSMFNTDMVTDMGLMFWSCSSLTSLDLSGFKTDNVTNMGGMFSDCSNLTSIDLSGFKTDNVTNMNSMFFRCSSLTSLDLSGFKTNNVTYMRYMFSDCSSLASLDVSGFKTEKVVDMHSMFYRCYKLTSLDLSGFKTDNVTDMGDMFSVCSGLTKLDLSMFNTDMVTDMKEMFCDCYRLTSLDLSGFKTDKVTNMNRMFVSCSALTTIFAGSEWNTTKVEDSSYMFSGCTNLVGGAGTKYDYNHTDHTYAHIDGGTSNPGYFTYKKAPVVTEPVPYAVLSNNNTVLTFYYDEQKAVRGGMTIGPFVGRENQPWSSQREVITTVVFDDSFADCITFTSTAYWFYGLSNLTTITGIKNLETDNVTDMRYMFSGCYNLTSLDVSHFDTSNVTVMWGMFSGCSSLKSLDVSGFQTDKVTSMGGMFSGCSGLTSLNLSGFVTDKVTNMSSMFSGCSSLTTLDVSGFKTDKVTDMYSMFDRCSSLTSLDVSGFKTDNVRSMSMMFDSCSSLTSLDVSGFRTDNVTSMVLMFQNCSSLTTIYAGSEWSTAKVEDGGNMFYNCTNLVGGAGTHYDANHTDYTYAHIDGGPSNPGYFTASGAEPWTEPGVAEPYAVLSDNNTVLTFYYDDQKAARGGMGVGPFTYTYDGSRISDLVRPDWFEQRESITTVVFDGSFANCTSLTSTAFWFYRCENLTSIEGIQNLKTDNVTDMGFMFDYCSSLTSLDVSGFNTSKVERFCGLFSGCSSLTSIDVSHFDTSNVWDFRLMFSNCSSLTELNVSNFNTEIAIAMGGMFQVCSKLTKLDLRSFKTENVFGMGWLFSGCSALTDLDISTFKTSSAGEMNAMFANCTSLTNIDVRNFDTSNVTLMQGMFHGCEGLTSLDVSHFNTGNVMDMGDMFGGCSGLTSLDVTSFKTDNVTDMDWMFEDCSGLTSLDLSSFNTSKVIYDEGNNKYGIEGMFSGCSSLTTIYVGDGWTTTNLTQSPDVFKDCTHLVGGAGTHYDVNHTDYTYAHIDGGPSNPGYFTDKNAPVITETVATPTFNVNGNDLSIVSTTDGASIYYTTDGTDPTTASTLYTIPVNLTQNCTVKAFAVKDGCIDSDVATFNVDWFQVVVRIIQNGTTVEMEATPADAEIHYTTDGSEPTAESTLYTEPLTPATDMTIRAIGLRDGFNASDIVSFNYSVGIVTVATPTFTANEAANTVSIETATEGATIYYTLDGSEPTTASTLYNGPVVLTRNCTVKAIAVCEGYYDSYVSSFDVNWFYAERPVMALDYASGTLTITCATAGSIIYYIIGDGETQAYNGTVTLTDNSTVRAWATAEGYDNSAEATLKPIQNGTANGQTFRISGAVTAQELLFLRNVMGSQVEHLDMADATLTDGGLADEAFRGMGLLTAQLPKSVGTVGAKLFDGCRRLAAVAWNAPTDITATALEGIGNPNLLLYVGSEATGSNAGVRNRIVNGTAQEITLSDPTARSASDCNFFCPIAFTANHISYGHIYTQQTGMDGKSRGWESLALPFDVQQVEHRVKGTVAPFGSSLDAPHFWLYELDGTGFATATEIKANRPYIIAMPQHPDYAAKYCLGGDSITFSAANAAVPVTAPQQATAGAKTLHANFTAQAASDDIFAINISDPYDDTHPQGSIFLSARRAVRPFEAYTTTTASGVRFIELFDDEANGIMEIECAQRSISDQSSNGYDLSGRRIADGQHRRQLPHKRLIINRGKVRTAK